MIWNAKITKQNKKSKSWKSNKKKTNQTNKQTTHARTHAWTWRWCITQKIIITRKRTGEPHKQSHKKACEQASTHTQKMTRRPQGPIYGVKQQQNDQSMTGQPWHCLCVTAFRPRGESGYWKSVIVRFRGTWHPPFLHFLLEISPAFF